MADVDNRLDREDGIRTMDELGELRNKNFSEKDHIEKVICELWESSLGYEGLAEKAAAELASLRERAEKAEAERDAVKELAKRARVQLQATQINWQEECLYECNDLLTLAIGACPSCTWRGDVTLQDGKCPYCKTDWLKLEGA